ncbi:serine hydrolase [uncultured Chitinophaga sp.]|uniref:serine hydrolase n=1 Tax=uncultured Chitinophaga sp. TaxID=339340 RepID=UPI0025EB8BA2|nr:serine hydrolase [uncultured Chitinophaga sp.]
MRKNSPEDASFAKILRSDPRLKPVLDSPAEYRLQVIYTRIDRDEHNQPHFTEFRYDVDTARYFYPASTVKMPIALAALEKINDLRIPGLTKYTTMFTDGLPNVNTAVTADSTAENGMPSIAHYIKKIFLVSDNDAANRLYEFVGQQELNENLWKKGYTDAQIRHRLDMPQLSPEANRHTNGVRFEKEGKLLYIQPERYSSLAFPLRNDAVGKGHMKNGQLVSTPFDFSLRNRLTLPDLHQMLKSIIFPENVTSAARFRLMEDDYRFLYRYMSQLPTETRYPAYDTSEFHHTYVKFLLFGADKAAKVPAGLRIFNKPGWAYGFLTDVAYIADFDNHVEFLLSATIYVNRDGVIGDDKYDFKTVGEPFLKALGEVVYQQELKRERKYKPDLSRYKVDYEKQ